MTYIVLFFISLLLTLFIKNYSLKKSLLAEVTDRSSHTIPTPHGGGIAIAITWFLGISYLFYTGSIDNSLYFALLVGGIISVVSYLDDLYELSAKVRLITQFMVTVLGLYFLNFFGNTILISILAIFMIVWFINLYNFLDGIDGYASSEAIFLGVAGFILYGESHFLVLVVAVLGFLVWNWDKAKIFMGDVGSTLLGYNIAIFTIYYANQEVSHFWIWIILFGVFWFDATITLYRRFRRGENIAQAHKSHAYQRLIQAGWSHSKVSIYAGVINILLFILVYFVSNLVFVSIISLVLLWSVMKYIDKKKAF